MSGQPLREEYYESRSGDFVRADITYFRQSFSLVHRVPDPGKWPAEQRFDYLIRSREMSKEEEASWRYAQETAVPREGPASYPQREAVLFVLRALLGKDAGTRSEDWRELLEKDGLPLK